MFKLILVVSLIALSFAAPIEDGTSVSPCQDKSKGTILPHPTDSHKFLKCETHDTLWVETCPDDLFYNPTLEICDWSVVSKSTTPSNEVVKHRPVLVRVKPVAQNTQEQNGFDQ
ncbi:putative peritrophin-1-like [Brachionus plicatilis]|uniref:Putative peritrophin-1-like n=1 Tax=Brachionus plicatilis TaxID=10195 RepID=A0A3M7R039_BRAPC|nr:putative peritrophin-1-like [Brachionus plicatilis]